MPSNTPGPDDLYSWAQAEQLLGLNVNHRTQDTAAGLLIPAREVQRGRGVKQPALYRWADLVACQCRTNRRRKACQAKLAKAGVPADSPRRAGLAGLPADASSVPAAAAADAASVPPEAAFGPVEVAAAPPGEPPIDVDPPAEVEFSDGGDLYMQAQLKRLAAESKLVEGLTGDAAKDAGDIAKVVGLLADADAAKRSLLDEGDRLVDTDLVLRLLREAMGAMIESAAELRDDAPALAQQFNLPESAVLAACDRVEGEARRLAEACQAGLDQVYEAFRAERRAAKQAKVKLA